MWSFDAVRPWLALLTVLCGFVVGAIVAQQFVVLYRLWPKGKMSDWGKLMIFGLFHSNMSPECKAQSRRVMLWQLVLFVLWVTFITLVHAR
jgi:hypothetical protein